MPIKIPNALPARETLEHENIFVMPEERAFSQDIRPLQLLLLNLMPTKLQTETQLLRLISNSPIQIDIELLQTSSYQSRNTPSEHLLRFYKTFPEIKEKRFDGLIITGAPVETMEFEEVDYWPELCEIMEWSKTHVYSTFHICWGAQAGLYYHFGVPKYPLEQKMFGVFEHRTLAPSHKLMRGFDELFCAPHSRHTEVRRADIEAIPGLQILAESDEAGVYIAAHENGRQFFVTGHSEYDLMTLADEYFRDIGREMEIEVPHNYFPGDDPAKKPVFRWRSHANLLYSNWINYFVYQETPYDLSML